MSDTSQASVDVVCVIGAGAIGSLFAAHLARIVPVVVLTRRADHARALSEEGLRVSGIHDFSAPLRATARVDDLPEFTLGIVATKTSGIDEAMLALAGHAPGATMVTIQNGLGAENLVRAHGSWPIVSGTTLMGGTRRTDTHVAYENDAPTWLGPHEGTPFARVEQIAGLIERSGLKARAFPDLRPAQWSKLIFNAAVGSVSAVTGLPHSRPFVDESGLGATVHDLIREGQSVAAAAGIELEDDPWQLNTRPFERDRDYSHAPSILLDIEAGQPTEADFNIGAVVREADRLGVPVPLTTALYRLLKAKEEARA